MEPRLKALGIELTAHQKLGLRSVSHHRVSLYSGSGGAGKTFIGFLQMFFLSVKLHHTIFFGAERNLVIQHDALSFVRTLRSLGLSTRFVMAIGSQAYNELPEDVHEELRPFIARDIIESYLHPRRDPRVHQQLREDRESLPDRQRTELEHLAKAWRSLRKTKVVHFSGPDQKRKAVNRAEKMFFRAYVRFFSVRVFFSTIGTAPNSTALPDQFDSCFFDEAQQISERRMLPILCRLDPTSPFSFLVLIGDPQQVPAIRLRAVSDPALFFLTLSLFERLVLVRFVLGVAIISFLINKRQDASFKRLLEPFYPGIVLEGRYDYSRAPRFGFHNDVRPHSSRVRMIPPTTLRGRRHLPHKTRLPSSLPSWQQGSASRFVRTFGVSSCLILSSLLMRAQFPSLALSALRTCLSLHRLTKHMLCLCVCLFCCFFSVLRSCVYWSAMCVCV
jgi:hypothetical protein